MTPRHARNVALLAAAMLSLAAGARCAQIDLQERARVGAERILLGDLAELTGCEAEVEALVKLDVGPAPLPGGERSLSVGYLKMRLRRAGIDCATVTFAGANEVLVSRPAPAVAPSVPTGEQAEGEGEVTAMPPEPVTIARGTRVQLTVICGAVQVMAEATTLDETPVGARAKLRVEQTRETVFAELISPTEAIIRRH